MLGVHVITAFLSLIFSTFLWFRPSQKRLGISYGLIAGTLISGFYLVVASHVSILRVCVTGLVFTAVSLVMVHLSERRLAKQSIQADK